MINWDEYQETYFGRLKHSQKLQLFDKILKEYKQIDVKELARELAVQPQEKLPKAYENLQK